MAAGDSGYAVKFDYPEFGPTNVQQARYNQRVASRNTSSGGQLDPTAYAPGLQELPSGFQVTNSGLDQEYLRGWNGLRAVQKQMLDRGIDVMAPNLDDPYAVKAAQSFQDLYRQFVATREKLNQGKALQDQMIQAQLAGNIRAPQNMGDLMTYDRANNEVTQLTMQTVDAEAARLAAMRPDTKEAFAAVQQDKQNFIQALLGMVQNGQMNAETAQYQIAKLIGPVAPDLEMRNAELQQRRAAAAASNRSNRGVGSDDLLKNLDPRIRNIAYAMGQRNAEYNKAMAAAGNDPAKIQEAKKQFWAQNGPGSQVFNSIEQGVKSMNIRGVPGAITDVKLDPATGRYTVTVDGSKVSSALFSEGVTLDQNGQPTVPASADIRKNATGGNWTFKFSPDDPTTLVYMSEANETKAREVLNTYGQLGLMDDRGRLKPERFYQAFGGDAGPMPSYEPTNTQVSEGSNPLDEFIKATTPSGGKGPMRP